MVYWTGPVDGVIDGVTQTALVAFRVKWKCKVTATYKETP